jgi:hypothetical protein
MTSQQYHVMPEWFEYFRRHIVLSGLLVAQGMVSTLLILEISVSDPGQWPLWTWVDWSNALVAVLMGGASAGVALGISSSMAEAFGMRKWVTGLFGFIGMLGLILIDVWAGIAERSRTARPTPADSLLADWTGIPALTVVPASVVIVACLLATLILYYGWTNRPPVVETEEQAALRRRQKLADAQCKADLRAIKAKGLATAGRAFSEGITGKQSTPLLPENDLGLTGEEDAPTAELADGSRKVIRLGKKTALQWTATDLQAYIREIYGALLADDTAVSRIQFLGDNKRLEGVPGRPYFANNRRAKAWADRQYSQQEIAD